MEAFVSVLLKSPDAESPAISHAIFIAKMFHRRIVLATIGGNICDGEVLLYKDVAKQVQEKSQIETQIWHIEDASFSAALRKIENDGAGIIILDVKDDFTPSFVAAHFQHLNIPYLCVQKHFEDDAIYKNMFISAKAEMQGKDKIVWARYLSHLLKGKITIVAPAYKDAYLKNAVDGFVRTAKEHVADHDIQIQIAEISGRANIVTSMLEESHKYGDCLIIASTSGTMNWLGKIFGTRETKYIGNEYGIPILCLNPRKDLYKEGLYA